MRNTTHKLYCKYVLIEWEGQFERFFDSLEEEGGKRLDIFLALMQTLQELDGIPAEETATLKRVRQGQKYPLWRVAHPYVPGVAIRIICWFPQKDQVVVAAAGFDKGNIGDIWYDSAVRTANIAIDTWKRENGQ